MILLIWCCNRLTFQTKTAKIQSCFPNIFQGGHSCQPTVAHLLITCQKFVQLFRNNYRYKQVRFNCYSKVMHRVWRLFLLGTYRLLTTLTILAFSIFLFGPEKIWKNNKKKIDLNPYALLKRVSIKRAWMFDRINSSFHLSFHRPPTINVYPPTLYKANSNNHY